MDLSEHLKPSHLHFFTITKEHETGTNNIVEVLHRFISDFSTRKVSWQTLHIQMEHGTREIKNRCIFSYIECLVIGSFFRHVEVSLLSMKHTHEDIDQAFSKKSERLKIIDAITLSDFHAVLRRTYRSDAHVLHMKSVANWSGLCEQEEILNPVQTYSQFRFFSFTSLSPDWSRGEADLVSCSVKVNETDRWKTLPLLSKAGHGNFLKRFSGSSKFPSISISGPTGNEEFTSLFEFNERCMNDKTKMHVLYKLRDHVFRTKEKDCHWNIQFVVECRFRRIEKRSSDSEPEVSIGSSEDEDTLVVNRKMISLDEDIPSVWNNYSYDGN